MILRRRKREHPDSKFRYRAGYMIGTTVIVFVILLCLTLSLPPILGYPMYSVVSGSMVPAIPVGSLIIAGKCPAEEIVEGDIIVFSQNGDRENVITHRVVSNQKIARIFVTKGDANLTKDMNPVTYDRYIGQVMMIIPGIGRTFSILTSPGGKVLLAALLGIAGLLIAVT